MKIALICTEKLPVPAVAGGAVQIYIDGVLPYLAKHHSITVFSISHPSLPMEETRNGIRYVRLPASSGAEYVSAIKSKLTKDFDLIHVFNRPASVLELSRGLPGVRFSLSLHNEMFTAEKLPAPKAEECISRVEFISTVSSFIANGVRRLYPGASGKLNVVYSGADAGSYKPNWSQEGQANKNRLKGKYKLQNYRVVLFIGRLSEKKGVHILLNAMKKVMSLNRDVALVIIGSKWFGSNKSDDYTESLRTLSAGLSGPIVFTGFLPPSEVISHYNLGDVFVCPSQWNEPLARVHYEAMAAGLPIITTNRGGNAEVVSGKGNGIVIDDFSNPDVLADNISNLLNNPARAVEMGKAGRKLVEATYNWERVAADLLRLFAKVEQKVSPVSAVSVSEPKVQLSEPKVQPAESGAAIHEANYYVPEPVTESASDNKQPVSSITFTPEKAKKNDPETDKKNTFGPVKKNTSGSSWSDGPELIKKTAPAAALPKEEFPEEKAQTNTVHKLKDNPVKKNVQKTNTDSKSKAKPIEYAKPVDFENMSDTYKDYLKKLEKWRKK